MQSSRGVPTWPAWVRALGILGELLITGAVVIGLFVLWYAFFNPWVVGLQQAQVAAEQSRQLAREIQAQTPTTAPPTAAPTSPSQASPSPAQPSAPASQPASPAAPKVPANVPVMAEPARVADTIGVIYIPRLGSDWRRILRESVDTDRVLNSVTAGVGHYTGTAMPGAAGNFAVAAHDIGYGNSFLNLSKLRLGDKIYIQTSLGWYTYTFRNFQFVQPDAVNVIDAVPTVSRTPGADRFITLTTCYPAVFPPLERVAAYGTFVGFDTAPPAELAPLLSKDG